MARYGDLVKLTLVKQSPRALDDEPGSTKEHKGNWNREVYDSLILEELHGTHLELPQGKVKAERRQDLGHGPLLGTESGELWGSQAKARLVNENQKQQGFGKLQGGVLPKRHTGVISRKDCWGS